MDVPAGWAVPAALQGRGVCLGSPHRPQQGARPERGSASGLGAWAVLINWAEFKILTQEAYTMCNLSFWSISAVWQFFPTASLSENS